MGELQDIPITFGGQTYHLRFGVKAIIALKRRWNLDSEADVQVRMKGADLEDGITVIWAGLQSHHPELTEEMVLGWVDDGGAEGLEAAQEAFKNAQPPPRPPPGQRPKATRRR